MEMDEEYLKDLVEVDLPFYKMNDDYVEGETLSNAIIYSLESSLPEYSVSVGRDGEEQVIVGSKRTGFSRVIPVFSDPYIEFEFDETEDHSYITAELGAPDEERLEDLYADLERLEAKLDGYFQQTTPGSSYWKESVIG